MFSFLTLRWEKRQAEMFRVGCSSVAAALSGMWPLWAPGLLVPQVTAGHQRGTAGQSRNGFWSYFSGPDLKFCLVQPLADCLSPKNSCECSALCAGEWTAPDAAQLSGIPHLRIPTSAHFCLSAFRPLDVVSRILSWALEQVNYLSPCKASLSPPSV